MDKIFNGLNLLSKPIKSKERGKGIGKTWGLVVPQNPGSHKTFEHWSAEHFFSFREWTGVRMAF